MASVGSNEFGCPVCFSLYTDPKLLPCHHVVCWHCVLTWLQRTGGPGECPVCRAPILSATSQGQGQLVAQVDKLQTDLLTQAFADGHKILTGDHFCGMCPSNVVGQDFCLQYSVKLCTSCTIYHQKLPATSHHTVQQLSSLTVSQLAARHQVKCQTHSHKVAKLYCTSHSELICHRCGSTTHRGCPEVKELEDVAKDERQKLKERLDRMKRKEKKMAEQVNAINEQFTVMRKKAMDVFDDLADRIEKRRRDVNNLIQAQEDAMKPLLADVDKVRVSTALPRRNMDTLVLDSPADGLLAMRQQLVSRFDKLESRLKENDDVRDMGCLVLDDQIITRLKADLTKLGQVQQPQPQPTSTPAAGATTTTSTTASGQLQRPQHQPTSTPAAGATATTSATASGQLQRPQRQPTSTPAAGATATTSATASGPGTAVKPEGAALARVLKVGDRVRLAPGAPIVRSLGGWRMVLPGDTGTVTAVPSRIRAARGGDPQGRVDVAWDGTGEGRHRMGRDDRYDLILA